MEIEQIQPILYLSGSTIIFLLGYYVFSEDSKRTLNRIFFIFSISGVLWGLSTALLAIFCPTYPIQREELLRLKEAIQMLLLEWVGIVAGIFLSSLFLHLSLIVTEKKEILKKKITPFLLYSPPFLYGIWILIHSFYFELSSKAALVKKFYLLMDIFGVTFFELFLLIATIFLFKKYLSLKSSQEKTKLRYFLIGALIPASFGSFFTLLLPVFFNIQAYIWLTFPIYTLGYIFIAIGVLRYGLFIDYREILETIFKRLSELVIVTDRQGLILLTNEMTLSKFGYKEEELAGRKIEEILKEGKEKWEEILKGLKEMKTLFEGRISFLTKNKEEIPFLLTGSQTKEGIIFVGRDIRELVEYQQRLEKEVRERTRELEEAKEKAEEEKNKTQAIILNFTDGLLVFDEKNNLTLINPCAENFFEVKDKEIIGKSISELAKISILKPLINLFNKEIKVIFRKELSIKENLILELSTVPILSQKEKIGTLIILHDITREKTVERLKTEFVSLAAHQLRSPLSAIKWTLRMMIDGDLGKITKTQKDFLEKTYRSNERMVNLINELLSITRIEEGRYIYRPTLAQLEEVCQSVIKSFQDEIKKRNLKFKFQKPREKLPKVLIDTEKMKLVVGNLIDNAIRYNKPGGKVTVSINRGIKEIEFKVEDTGVGIPEDQQKRVFTKFFRAANVMRMETEGTGLGLFVTKNIVEAHGGKIWFISEENKGTTFYFALPIST